MISKPREGFSQLVRLKDAWLILVAYAFPQVELLMIAMLTLNHFMTIEDYSY